MYFPCQRPIALLLLWAHLFTSCIFHPHEPILLPASAPSSPKKVVLHHASPSSVPFLAKEGISLSHAQGNWQAKLWLAATEAGKRTVPISFGVLFSPADLEQSDQAWQEKYVHLLPKEAGSPEPGSLYIGIKPPEKTPRAAHSPPGAAAAEHQSLGPITVQGDHQVSFQQVNGKLQARVTEALPSGLRRELGLFPVRFAAGYSIKDLKTRPAGWQRDHIQVVFPEKTQDGQGLVLVGGQGGLRGGGNSSSSASGCSCRYYYVCECGFRCPNDNCFDHCAHHCDKCNLCKECCGCSSGCRCERERLREEARKRREEQARREEERRIAREIQAALERQAARERQQERERWERERREKERQEQEQRERERHERERRERERRERERRERERLERERQERENEVVAQASASLQSALQKVAVASSEHQQEETTDLLYENTPQQADFLAKHAKDGKQGYTTAKFAQQDDLLAIASASLKQPAATPRLRSAVQPRVVNVAQLAAKRASFLDHYTKVLPAPAQEVWAKEMVPMITKKLPEASLPVQAAVLNYFTTGGSIYPSVLKNLPASAWVQASLCNDISRGPFAHETALSVEKFDTLVNELKVRYQPSEVEKLLYTLKAKQQFHALDLRAINDVLTCLLVSNPSILATFLSSTLLADLHSLEAQVKIWQEQVRQTKVKETQDQQRQTILATIKKLSDTVEALLPTANGLSPILAAEGNNLLRKLANLQKKGTLYSSALYFPCLSTEFSSLTFQVSSWQAAVVSKKEATTRPQPGQEKATSRKKASAACTSSNKELQKILEASKQLASTVREVLPTVRSLSLPALTVEGTVLLQQLVSLPNELTSTQCPRSKFVPLQSQVLSWQERVAAAKAAAALGQEKAAKRKRTREGLETSPATLGHMLAGAKDLHDTVEELLPTAKELSLPGLAAAGKDLLAQLGNLQEEIAPALSGSSDSRGQDWFYCLKVHWLQVQLANLKVPFSAQVQRSISHALASLDLHILTMEQLLEGLDSDTKLDELAALINFIATHGTPEKELNQVFSHRAPANAAGLSVVAHWLYQLQAASLCAKLRHLAGAPSTLLQESLRSLLRHQCTYESLDKLLDTLAITDATAASVAPVLDLLAEYRVAQATCNEVFAALEKEAVAQWLPTAHQLVIAATFKSEHTYSKQELINKITQAAPEVSFCTKTNLKKYYHLMGSTYGGPSQALQAMAKAEGAMREELKAAIIQLQSKPIATWDKQDIQLWARCVKGDGSALLPAGISQEELFAVVTRAVKLTYDFYPRNTQLLAVCMLLNPEQGKGRLAQLKTGEGKSLIVAMLAAIHALQGKKVDVVTTSSELSRREAAKQADFFALFNLSVGENSDFRTKSEVYTKNIVYGTAGNFQGDILRTEFQGKAIRGKRGFEVVLVDEVDSMLFDKRSQSTRLAERTPGMDHLEGVLGAIWSHITLIRNHIVKDPAQDNYIFIADNFQVDEQGNVQTDSGQTVAACSIPLDDPVAFIKEKTQAHIEKTLRDLTPEEATAQESYQADHSRCLALGKAISHLGDEIEKEKAALTLKKLKAQKSAKEKELASISDSLKKSPWPSYYPTLAIPHHLKGFARHQIPYWIDSALGAKFAYHKNSHYAIQGGKIVPINYHDTGVFQPDMVWSNGLAQFLQLKEKLIIYPESLATNYLSASGFFKRYGHQIYGLTGTLGTTATQEFFSTIYGTDRVVVPPYKQRSIVGNKGAPYSCKELPALVVSDPAQWYEAICKTTLSKARQQRGVLVICQYVSQVAHLAELLSKQYPVDKIFTYTGKQEEDFTKDTIEAGEIILATNIAGRGTDLTPSAVVEAHGGLHVCITFLPASYRVELQNVGRTARQGKKGSAQLVLYDAAGSSIQALKEVRNEQEQEAIAAAKSDIKRITLQDELFVKFCSLLRTLIPSLADAQKVKERHEIEAAYQLEEEAFTAEILADQFTHHVETTKTNKLAEIEANDYGQYPAAERAVLKSKAKATVEAEIETYLSTQFETWKAACTAKRLDAFCSRWQGRVASDVMASFRARTPFIEEAAQVGTAAEFGHYERQGLAEQWAMWHHQIFAKNNTLTEAEILASFEAFSAQMKAYAADRALIQNPFYEVQQGNDKLSDGHIEAALACYERAIDKDPNRSLYAHLNKAHAYLSYKKNKGEPQQQAKAQFEACQRLIDNVYRPGLLELNTLLSQADGGGQTSAHIQHQMDILSQVAQHAEEALKVLNNALDKGWNVQITEKNSLEHVFKEADPKQDYTQATQEARLNGLTHLYKIQEKKTTPWWSIIGIGLLGIAQITAGVLVTACTGGTLGTGLISEGVSDLITTVKAAITGTFSWAAWATQKAISMAVSLISAGWDALKKGLTAIKDTVKETAANVAKAAQSFKTGLKVANQQLGLALGKGVAKECLHTLADMAADKLFMEDLEQKITETVAKKLTAALAQNELVQQALALDVSTNSNYYQNLFIQAGLQLLEDKQSRLMQILLGTTKGVLTNKVPGAGKVLQGAALGKLVADLTTFTDRFLADFNKQVAKHQQDIEQALQAASEQAGNQATRQAPCQETEVRVIPSPELTPDATSLGIHTLQPGQSYCSTRQGPSQGLATTYCAPSDQGHICRAFQGRITHKLTNSVQSNLVQPVTHGLINNGVDRFTQEAAAAIEAQRKAHRSNCKLRKAGNKLSTAPSPKQTGTTAPEALSEATQAAIRNFEAAGPQDKASISVLSHIKGRIVYVFNEQGVLEERFGQDLPGPPLALKYISPKAGESTGHYQPLDPTIPFGRGQRTPGNNCLLDALAAIDPSHTPAELRSQAIEAIKAHPQQANQLYQAREKLAQRDAGRLFEGGNPAVALGVGEAVAGLASFGTPIGWVLVGGCFIAYGGYWATQKFLSKTTQEDGQPAATKTEEGAAAAAPSTPELDDNEKKKSYSKKEARKQQKTARKKGFDPQKKGPPKSNVRQNTDAKSAKKEIESRIGRKLEKDEWRNLHDRVTKQGYGYHDIVEIGIDLFQK